MAYIFQGLSQIFPAVSSHGNDTFAFEVDGVQFSFMEGIIFFDGMCQCVDNGIAGDENAVSVNVFFQQMFLCQFGRRKMQVCQRTCQAAVHFFGERLILIIGTQTSFHMTHFHLIIICSPVRARVVMPAKVWRLCMIFRSYLGCRSKISST